MKGFLALFGQKGNTLPLRDLNRNNMTAGLVSSLLAMTGPPILILQAAANGNFTLTQTITWIFAAYVMGGLYSILLPLYYRIPIAGANTITGVAFLATITSQFTYNELIGAYFVSGLCMFIIGYFGFFKKLLGYVPKEVLSAMLAGMIIKYMVDFVISVEQMAVVGLSAVIVYFLFSKWVKQIPPIIAGITAGFIMLFLTEAVIVNNSTSTFIFSSFHVPEFNLISFISVSLPLALLILSNDAAVGIGGLEQNQYKPPVNRIITTSGIFSMIASFFGAQSANIAGMMSAICADREAGPKEKRYMGAVVSGIIVLLFGVFAFKLVPFILALPTAFVSILTGFALLGVFANSLYLGFSNDKIKIGAACSFLIAASGISVLHISAPVWALIIGTFIVKIVETDAGNQGDRKKKSA